MSQPHPHLDVPICAEGFLALSWGLNSLVFAILVIRLVLHRRQKLKGPAIVISDVLICISFFFGIALISMDAWMYSKEIEARTRKLSLHDKETFPKLFFLCGYLVFSAMWFSKGAFVVYYYHLFTNLSKKLKYYLMFVTIFTMSTYIFIMLLQTLWCRPIWTNWTLDPLRGCSATGNTTTHPLWSFMNIATDIFILAVPLSVLHTLQLRRRQVVALVVVFLIGGLSIFAAVARFVIMFPEIKKNAKAPIVHAYELWALIEIASSQLTVCLPALRGWLRGRKDNRSRKTWGGNGRKTVSGVSGGSSAKKMRGGEDSFPGSDVSGVESGERFLGNDDSV
ncbi:hypothetical protein B9Z19DRAFT_28771 [Tuber borchii]|uniref:Rhodopsin domain-containing protein n=1 Tax=Tuber borchii TaxID=42251 RepID=A0A2T6ZTS0_TUBBO|nr:hypothetical protein B9Z19DRAFT_28771 [Tuber borchii]